MSRPEELSPGMKWVQGPCPPVSSVVLLQWWSWASAHRLLEAVEQDNAQEKEEPNREVGNESEAALGRSLLPAEAQLLPPRPQHPLPLQLLPVVRAVESVEVEGRRDGPAAGERGGGGADGRRSGSERAARGLGGAAHVLAAEDAAVVLAAQRGTAQHQVGLADGGEALGGGSAACVAVGMIPERLLVVRRLDLRLRRRGRDAQHLVQVAARP